VTRGALYHHYADKQELFRAVFEQLESELSARIAEAARIAGAHARAGPLAGMLAAVATFWTRASAPR